MNKVELIGYLEGIDRALETPATLYIYGSAACILMDEPERTSLDIDVAGPYSQADEADVRRAAGRAGLPVNPGEDYGGDHIEWVGPLRLCLQPPVAGAEMTLWQGSKLCIRTGPVADLVASKLIRCDEGRPQRCAVSVDPGPHIVRRGQSGGGAVARTIRPGCAGSREPGQSSGRHGNMGIGFR
jgi:hypothetical protein